MSIEKQLMREGLRRLVRAEQAGRPDGKRSEAQPAALAPQRTGREAIYYEVREGTTLVEMRWNRSTLGG